MEHLHGLLVAIPTPFDADGRIDFDYVTRHLDFIGDRGADGIVVCGTNGEGQSMSFSERVAMFRVSAAHRKGLSLVAGTGCSSLAETIELSRAAEKLGADAALVMPPFLFKNPSLEGLFAFYARVLAAVELPVYLYNIPEVSAVEIEDELVERLAGFPNLAGVKDSAGDAERTKRYCDRFPDLSVFYGADRVMEAMSGTRAKGAISGIANAFPELISETMNACAAGNGHELQIRVNELTYMLDRYPSFAANKYVLHLRGFPRTYVRPPLIDLSPDQEKAFERELKSGGYL